MRTQFNDKINRSLSWLVIKDPYKQKIEHKVTFLSISFNNSMIKINMSLAWLVIIEKKK